MAGRPPKPTALKKLEGTYRADRAVSNEMMPARLLFAPTPPSFLSAEAKKEWKSACQELIELDMLHRVDLPLLMAYCQEMANYIHAVKALKKEGMVKTISREDGSSYSMPSPYISIKNSALKNAQSIAGQFGFTPSARSKINAGADPKEDPFEDMLNMD